MTVTSVGVRAAGPAKVAAHGVARKGDDPGNHRIISPEIPCHVGDVGLGEGGGEKHKKMGGENFHGFSFFGYFLGSINRAPGWLIMVFTEVQGSASTWPSRNR